MVSANGLDSISYNDGATPSVNYAYDRRGRQVGITNGATTCILAYDDAGLLLSETWSGGPLNNTVVTNVMTRCCGGLMRSRCNGGGVIAMTTNTYDAASRLLTTSDRVNSGTYSYLANSPVVNQITFKQSATTHIDGVRP